MYEDHYTQKNGNPGDSCVDHECSGHDSINTEKECIVSCNSEGGHNESNESEDFREKWMRALADSENMRKRLISEKDDAVRFAVFRFAKDLLDVLDNFERARTSCSTINDESSKYKSFSEGIALVEDQLQKVLKRFGVEEVVALDCPFDPNIHQAISQEKLEGKESGIITSVMQRGYYLNERVLRPALVIVSE